MLDYFGDPAAWHARQHVEQPNISTDTAADVLERAMPELKGKTDFYDLLLGDLVRRGLLTGGGYHVTVSGEATLASRVTPRGTDFLRFISKQ